MNEDTDFLKFADYIRRKAGLDLLLYKRTQVERRLKSLFTRKGYRSFTEFASAVERNPELFRDFMNQLTINVTEFYRNPTRWETLTARVAPHILKQHGRIKCWSAACSTGEEPYSMVMALSSITPLQTIDVYATDLDERILALAKQGEFSERAIQGITKAELRRFFIGKNGMYRVKDEVLSRVRFAQHNLLADVYPSGFDLIACRNVLIYFTDEAKESIYHKFHAALNPGGHLFVGATEQIINPAKFGFVSGERFFYQKVSS